MNLKLSSPKLNSQVDKRFWLLVPLSLIQTTLGHTFKKPSPKGVISLKVIVVDIIVKLLGLHITITIT